MNAIAQAALWLSKSHKVVAFTGAGISTESGIPDYRSPGGVWATNQPVYFDDFLSSSESRYEYWRQKSISQAEFETTLPNKAHAVLAKWESQAKLRGVITQNIDEKHQEAGSENVLELHGTARKVSCLECHAFFPATPWVEQFLETDVVPDCPECGGLLKHATVSFGQQLPEGTLLQAMSWSKQADLFFALGSSLVVHPAASLPQIAKEAGAKLVIINNTETPLDRMADLVIREPLGATLSAIDETFQDRIS